MLDIKVDGINELSQQITADILSVEFGVERAVKSTSSQIEKKAKDLAPHDSGDLEESISAAMINQSTTVKSAEVTTDIDYADVVEFGGFNRPAQPFMRPAAIDGDAVLASEIEKTLRKLRSGV